MSPILFMLFITSLFKIFIREDKKTGLKIWGYVDNDLLTSVVSFENKAIIRLQNVFANTKKWVYKNKINFYLGKFEAINFSKKWYLPNCPIQR